MKLILDLIKKIPTESFKWIIIICLVFVFGVICGFKCDKQEVQTIDRTTIKTDSVIVYDTIRVEKPIIKYKEKVEYRYIHDTIQPSTPVMFMSVNDTVPCLTIEGTSERGTYVQAELCSKLFPKQIPLDITSNIEIREAPDTIKTITIQDTVIYKKPWYKDSKNYIIGCLLGITTGLIITR